MLPETTLRWMARVSSGTTPLVALVPPSAPAAPRACWCGRVRQRAESAGKCPERLTEHSRHGERESLVGKKPAHLEGGYVQSENVKNGGGRI